MKNDIQIELHVPDFTKVIEFYGKLGFEKVWSRNRNDIGDYLVLRRGNTVINFWPGNETVLEQPYFKQFPTDTKRGYGVEIVIPVENVEQLFEQIKEETFVVEPLTQQPWGRKDFRIVDPFGYYLRITEPHDITDSSNQVV